MNLNSAAFLKRGDQVVDLLALNGQAIEFEAEFESGIEVEKDDD